jgi:CRISPR-associated protein Csx16
MLFLRTGRSDGVAEHTERLGRDLGRLWAEHKEGPPPALAALGRELQRFGRNLETVRTGALLFEGEGSAARVAQRLRAARGTADAPPPLADVLDRLENEMLLPLIGAGQDLTSAEGHRALAALARLYLRMRRWAEAAAIVREGWVT